MNNVMTQSASKDTYIQVRIREDLKEDVQTTAKARGLTMSALIHSLLTQAVRAEKEAYPEAFATRGVKAAEVTLAPVVATITPAHDPKDEIRRTMNADEAEEAKRRTTPRNRKTG